MSDVAALLREREGLIARGLKGRVAQVDAVLKEMGIGVDDAPTAPETATVEAPENAMQPAAKPRKGK